MKEYYLGNFEIKPEFHTRYSDCLLAVQSLEDVGISSSHRVQTDPRAHRAPAQQVTRSPCYKNEAARV